MMKLTVLLLFVFSRVFAAETCSRVALINYQEVLVDVSSRNLGEGLRYYLEKDAVSKQLLDEYQANNNNTWKSVATSSLGTIMILAGAFRSNSGQGELLNRNALLFGGIGLIGLSYFMSKADQAQNENLLTQSIDEYNKRNTPKIFFSPTNPKDGVGGAVGFGQEF